ncbi:conserved exported hypothetical protein [Agrobacterium genomosp. 2 str. CFBP 5494]|uniref:Uncharacterized protein n=1 Tax=Agrobacterium genomosp. 2 str. CFBP 5494 TaxID=1183436 RepID=A0A9W5F0R6_9HYPH|nr:conserved exported hypothetical protein [Agrobacterium genomosp. 2 str. CFBP 5494]
MLPVLVLRGAAGATVLLADVFRCMAGDKRAALRITSTRIAMPAFAVTRLTPATGWYGGWIGRVNCS